MDAATLAVVKQLIADSGGGGIPPAGTGDNGKILQVVNGSPQWVALTAAEEVSF